MTRSKPLVIVKGAGDLATGTAYRLFKCGLEVIMTEINNPLVVRRTVAFAEAVYSEIVTVEGITARHAETIEHAVEILKKKTIPVLVDPAAVVVGTLRPMVVVDAIMAKHNLSTKITDAPLVIGLGPGFTAGMDVDAVVETCRGHRLGRAIYKGSAAPNSGVPGEIMGYTKERLLCAPADGVVKPVCYIGEQVEKGDVVARVGENPIVAEIHGIIRGMIKSGTWVTGGTKIGDIDPRCNQTECFSISDKALAVGGGVVEVVFNYLSERGICRWNCLKP